jgi:TIR domain
MDNSKIVHRQVNFAIQQAQGATDNNAIDLRWTARISLVDDDSHPPQRLSTLRVTSLLPIDVAHPIRSQRLKNAIIYLESVAKRKSSFYRVFLSHSHKDGWIARQCAKLIEEGGKPHVKVFVDEKDIEGGQSIPESVRTGIEQCDEFLVLLSRYSKDRSWVLIEMGAAWGLHKPIVVIIDKIAPEEMPDIKSHDKAIDLNDFDQYITQLLKRVKTGR